MEHLMNASLTCHSMGGFVPPWHIKLFWGKVTFMVQKFFLFGKQIVFA